MKKIILLAGLLMLMHCNLEKIEEGGGNTFAISKTLSEGYRVQVESVCESEEKGGLIVSGTLSSNSGSFTNLFILKVNSDGTTIKLTTNFGTQPTRGGKMIKIGNGNYYVIGTKENGQYNNEMLVAKYNNDLNNIWTGFFRYTIDADCYGAALTQRTDGRLVALGNYSRGQNEGGPWTVLINENTGIEIQHQIITTQGTGRYWAKSIAKNGSAFGLLCHRTDLAGIDPPLPPHFVKTDANFNVLISKDITSGGGYLYGEILPDNTDGYILAHGRSYFSSSEHTAFFVPVNSNGVEGSPVLIWNNYPSRYCGGASKTTTGQYLPCGWKSLVPIYSPGASQAIASLVSSNFEVMKTYVHPSTNEFSQFRASTSISDGGYVFAGQDGHKLLLVKLNSNFEL